MRNLVENGPFSLERLLSHVDPGPGEESEDFVRLIYAQRDTGRAPLAMSLTGAEAPAARSGPSSADPDPASPVS